MGERRIYAESDSMSYRSASARAAAFDDAVREAMSATVSDGIPAEPARRPTVTAGADVPERYAADAVATVAAVLDTESDTTDGDRVEHERKARVRRWQAVDPRERRT